MARIEKNYNLLVWYVEEDDVNMPPENVQKLAEQYVSLLIDSNDKLIPVLRNGFTDAGSLPEDITTYFLKNVTFEGDDINAFIFVNADGDTLALIGEEEPM